MKRTNTQSIADILQDFLAENPLLNEKMAETRLMNAWGEILGHLTMRHTTKLYISKRILYVHISSAVLRSELTLCREKLIERLNEKAGMTAIDDIVFRGG